LNDSRIGNHIDDDVGVRASMRTFSSRHAQHGVALFVSLGADVVAGETRGSVVVVPAECEHEVNAPGPVIGICFDPERMPRVHAFVRAQGRPTALDGKLAARLTGLVRAHRAAWERADVLRGIADEAHAMFAPAQPRIDRRVLDAAAVIRADDRRVDELRPDELHAAAHARHPISAAHLQALFARDIGTSMRTYRLWHRLLRALRAFSTSDATSAAHAAGFADLAHFSRTCRRMLGYSPTSLRDGVQTMLGQSPTSLRDGT
jgi:AraC-like DNA-binding protein